MIQDPAATPVTYPPRTVATPESDELQRHETEGFKNICWPVAITADDGDTVNVSLLAAGVLVGVGVTTTTGAGVAVGIGVAVAAAVGAVVLC